MTNGSDSESRPPGDTADVDDWEALFGGTEQAAEAPVLPPLRETPEEEAEVPTASRYLGFRLDSELYALPIVTLSEIVKMREFTVVPHTRPFVLGVISVRGRIVPVIDLQRRLLPALANGGGRTGEEPAKEEGWGARPAAAAGPMSGQADDTDRRRLLIAKDRGESVGLVVDSVTSVFVVEPADIEPPPPTLSRRLIDYVSGIARREGAIHILLETGPLLDLNAIAEPVR